MDMMTKGDIAKTFGLSERTVRRKIQGIESLIGTRYEPYAVARVGKKVLCNSVCFIDYITFEKGLTTVPASVPKFNYQMTKQYLGRREHEQERQTAQDHKSA